MKRLLVLLYVLSSLTAFSQDEVLDGLRIELTFQNPDTTKVETSLKIIKLLFEADDYESALKYIDGTEKLSESLQYTKGLAKIEYYKGLIYNQKDDYITATNHLKESKKLFLILKDTLSLTRINNQLGVFEIERGNYKKGLQYALDGIKFLENNDHPEDLGILYSCLAKAYTNIGANDKAIDYNLKSLDIFQTTKNNNSLIAANTNLAILYYKNEDYKKAIKHYEIALNFTTNENLEARANILPDLGSAYIKTNDYNTATEYLAESIKINRHLKNSKGIIKSLNNLGELNLIKKRYRTAENQLLEAGNIGRINNYNQELLKNYKLMKIIDSTKGNFESAFAWQREYYKIKSNIAAKKLKFSPTAFEEDSTNNIDVAPLALSNTIATPVVEAVENKRKLDRLKLIFYAVLAAFAVVLVFFALFYFKRNSRIKYTRDLEAKNIKIKLQNEAILEQTKHLESINNVKDKLFSIVSHDLKDSLTSTKGFIDLLKEGQLSQEEFHNLLPELSENANNASLLLFNLLNWSKSQMQSLDPKPSLFDIQEVFNEKLKLVEQKMQTKGITLIDKTLKDFVYADRSMVEIIIQNLLANAVKFCVKDDTITVSNSISNGNSVISIADSGVGITVENQHKLFGNSTFSTVGTDNEKGTGLGLTICRELVELNKGRIWVDSELHVGSTFFIELPKTSVKRLVNI